MKFRVIYQPAANNAHSPARVVEQNTGREIGWINRYLDREYVRRLANTSLRIYACNLLHFVRWWESVHHTGDVAEGDLAESTLLDYVRFQSGPQPRPSGSTINDRVALFLMDYNRRERLKILGHAKVVDARTNEALARSLAMPGYPAKIERAFMIRVAATDWNCPQHIKPRVG